MQNGNRSSFTTSRATTPKRWKGKQIVNYHNNNMVSIVRRRPQCQMKNVKTPTSLRTVRNADEVSHLFEFGADARRVRTTRVDRRCTNALQGL